MASALPPALAPRTTPRELLHPPSADNAGLGLGMSVLAHAALLAALTLGVQWRTQSPEGVSAELWAATPQIAAPPRPQADAADPTPPSPARPTPAPAEREAAREAARAQEREAQIATEKAERERRDKARQEAEAEKARAEKAAQDKAAKAEARKAAEAQERAKAERDDKERERLAQAQRDKLHQDQLKRMQQQLGGGPSGSGAPGSTGTAARDAGPSAGYAGRIKARIKPNIVLTDEVAGNPLAEVEVKVAPDGSILSRRIVTASGSKAWDEAVLRAIDRTQMLPRDVDGRVPPTLVIAFKPQE